MIESVEMFNFRIHKRRLIEFSSGVNCLIGSNDKGKSTVINALRWVVFNRPLGNSMVRWGETRAKVKLKTNGRTVVRQKTQEANNYTLDGGKPYDAIGTTVPDDVSKALKLDEINFQRQIDAPFWLSKSGPEVAKEMNRVVDLEVIDRAMAYAASKVRQGNTEVKLLKKMTEEAEAKIKSLAWVSKAEAKLVDAISREQEARAATRKAERLRGLVEQLKEADGAVVKIPDTSTLDTLITQLKLVIRTQANLTVLVEQIKEEDRQLCRIEKLITRQKEELKKLTPKMCKVCGQVIRPIPDLS